LGHSEAPAALHQGDNQSRHGLPQDRRSRAATESFRDADMAGDIDGWKNTSGMLVFIGPSPIVWQSQKQKVVELQG